MWLILCWIAIEIAVFIAIGNNFGYIFAICLGILVPVIGCFLTNKMRQYLLSQLKREMAEQNQEKLNKLDYWLVKFTFSYTLFHIPGFVMFVVCCLALVPGIEPVMQRMTDRFNINWPTISFDLKDSHLSESGFNFRGASSSLFRFNYNSQKKKQEEEAAANMYGESTRPKDQDPGKYGYSAYAGQAPKNRHEAIKAEFQKNRPVKDASYEEIKEDIDSDKH